MKLIAIVAILMLPSASFASPDQVRADWRKPWLEERVRAALTGQGWRLEDDGSALDPGTKAPASEAELAKAVLDLRQGARRAALEAVTRMLASGKALTQEDRRSVELLSADLSAALTAAMLDPKSDMNKVRAMAGADLSRVASYFDGGRTLADRQAAAQPVSAGTPGTREPLPYFNDRERSVGRKIRASAAAEIGRDPFGRDVLSRLNGASGEPTLPPIVIEDQSGSVAAHYDIRRRTIVLDREVVLASVVATVPSQEASRLRASLSTRAALLSYLDAHPAAVTAVVKDNDVLLVHELIHAWQDRRDTIFREIARGNLPDVQPLEYEEEASIAKNLYIHSKVRHDPASVKLDREFEDYRVMLHSVESWRLALNESLNSASPSRALSLPSVREIQAARLARAKKRSAATADEQAGKSFDLLALNRAQRAMIDLEAAHARRMAPVTEEVRAHAGDRAKVLGEFYLGRALGSEVALERGVLLDKAEMYAKASRNAILIEEVRKARNRT